MKFIEAIINVALAVLSVPFEIAKMWGELCQNQNIASSIDNIENVENIDNIDNIYNIENIETSNRSGSSGYNSSDDDCIQFHVIKTPPGVKTRVIPFRRGSVQKFVKHYQLEHCG